MIDFRIIPSIEQLRQREAVRLLEAEYGREAVIDGLRAEADLVRRRLAAARQGGPIPPAWTDETRMAAYLEDRLTTRLNSLFRPSLNPVVNATGIIVHTNLGRAPLALAAARRVAALAAGYSNLEYDLARGERGARDVHAATLLTRLTGAEAALVVNNNAAATLLMLAALAAGREVVISRGELVEIGGGFRVPEVMAQSGAILREVGTTNKTRIGDYAAALGPETALILRVHRSNFRIDGFTEQPRLEELVQLGRTHAVPVVEDLGSGLLEPPGGDAAWTRLLRDEPTVQASVRAGLDLLCFSGDKLLGGPQAGILIGRRDLVDAARRHPLMRALRVDKMTYAALEATLLEHLRGRAAERVPVVAMMALAPEAIEGRARAVAERLRGTPRLRLSIVDGVSMVGGGSAPGLEVPTRLLSVTCRGEDPSRLDARLRAFDPPVIARIESDALLIDLRTVRPEEDGTLAAALAAAAAPEPQV